MNYYAKLVRHQPEDVSALYNYGTALYNADRYAEAIIHLEKCLELGAGDYEPNIRFNLGLCLEVSGEIDQAIQQFKQTVALIPDDAEAASKVGAMLQARADQPPRAASSTPGGRREKDPLPEIMLAWERVLAIDPECAEAHLRLGLVYEQQDRTEDALNSYLAATKFDPSNADAAYNAARRLSLQLPKEKTKEEKALEAATGVDPSDEIKRAAAPSERAISLYRAALELAPESSDAHNNLGIELGKYALTSIQLAQVARKERRNDDALFLDAATEARTEEAVYQIDEAIRIVPHYGAAHFNMARVLVELGDWRGADGELALDALEAAMDNGYLDAGSVEKDPSLARLRDSLTLKKRFIAVLNDMSMREAAALSSSQSTRPF